MMSFLKKFYPLLAITAVVIWALIAIALRRAEEAPPGTIVLRIGHWQLEASVRDAINIMAEDYRKLHPNVHIVQDAIPEMVYGQWTTTQLMGGTAPDLLEVGLGVLPRHLWLQYYNRYCHALTRYANEPNPYNAGTELEGVRLRSTIKDGMRWTYIDEMQEYVAIPLAQFGVRIFYNRDLLKKLTGLEEPPHDYRAFIELCQSIRSHRQVDGEPYTAIAASKYHLGMWESYMLDGITYPAIRKADFNRDGVLGGDESFVATRAGLLDFNFPPYRARFDMLRELTEQFQTGFAGLTRDEAVFQFVQQQAVFMATGTWDARGLQEQSGGQFTVGVMDFPRPGPDDPRYGKWVEGPLFEQPYVGFAFAITRTSPHFEQALDFLRFLAGQQQNEKLNRIIGWMPSVKGTELDPALKAFEPHLEGVIKAFNSDLGGETWLKWMQLYSLYQVDQLSFDELRAQFEPFYKERGYQDFMEQQRDWRRGMHLDEEMLAGLRATALLGRGGEAESAWVKYRSLTGLRQVTPEILRSRQLNLIEHGPRDAHVGPYDYSPAVLEKIRARLAAGDATP
jgi:raffinose/stachyose/melibiose transport system substrate-binding protein